MKKGMANTWGPILNIVPAGIVLIDSESRVIFGANKAAIDMIGLPEGEVVGHACHNFICPAEQNRCPILDLGQLVYNSETVLLKGNGEKMFIIKTAAPLDLRGRKFLCETFIDITERKRDEEKLRRSERELRLLSRRIIGIQEEERTRIACDLHDQLGQTLVALKIDANSLAEQLDNNPALHEQALGLVDLTDLLLTTVRHISATIRPDMLDKLGLVKAVQWYAEDFERNTGISCPVNVVNPDIALSKETNNAAYRILLETLNNVVQHSRASQVKIGLMRKGDTLVMSVADNGVGMDMSLLSGSSALGLLGMRERAHLAGGWLKIQSRPGKGTRVLVHLPIAQEQDRESNK